MPHLSPSNAPAIRYQPHWLTDADDWLAWCTDEVAWRAETIHMMGRRIAVPRLLAWFGDEHLSYRYSGREHPACGWPEPLLALRDRVTQACGFRPNYVLLNQYRCGRDWLGWHRDDERRLAHTHVASISLGATRRLRIGRAPSSQTFDLEHGSLLLFDAAVAHTLSKTARVVGPRINLTWRSLTP